MEGTIFLLVAAFAAVYAAPITEPTGVEIPCSTLESHFAAEGRRLFTNGEGTPFVTCSRLCINPRGRVMRYYYCCTGYEPLIASSVSSSRTILDVVADHIICVPSTEATAATSVAPTKSSVFEMRKCPARNEPQTLNDFIYAAQDDLCRFGCIYQEIVDQQRDLIRNVTKIFYSCCPPHEVVAFGAFNRPSYKCATAEQMSDPSNSANNSDVTGGSTAPPELESTQKATEEAPTDVPESQTPPRDTPSEAPTDEPTDAPNPSTDAPNPSTDEPKPSTDAPKPSTDAPKPSTDAPKPPTPPRDTSKAPTDGPKPPTVSAPSVPPCPNSGVPQTTNQFTFDSQTRLCLFPCTYGEVHDLGFDTVTRLVTKTIYGCCSPYKAVAVGAVNRPMYECQ